MCLKKLLEKDEKYQIYIMYRNIRSSSGNIWLIQ